MNHDQTQQDYDRSFELIKSGRYVADPKAVNALAESILRGTQCVREVETTKNTFNKEDFFNRVSKRR
jgi:hypothetical protein